MSERPAVTNAERVWINMSTLVLDVDRRRMVADAVGMSFGRAKALRRIAARSMTMGELASVLGTDPPYMTLVVDDLEQRGLVARTDHPTDRRAKLVVATPRGLELAREAERILAQPPADLLALSSDDLQVLDRLLADLVAGRSGATVSWDESPTA
ncbi:MAG: MarR family transcriptional regulator [Acidimicrobiales bacterium]